MCKPEFLKTFKNKTMDYFMNVIRNHYADFEGRARRAEYWNFFLFNLLGLLAIVALIFVLGSISESLATIGILAYAAWGLGLFIPGLAVAVRRLHDTGKSGWWILVSLIPLAGIVLIVFMCIDSDPGTNAYGPNPKEENYNVSDHLVE